MAELPIVVGATVAALGALAVAIGSAACFARTRARRSKRLIDELEFVSSSFSTTEDDARVVAK